MCGIKGMETGVYKHIVDLDLIDAYLRWPEDIERSRDNVSERKLRAGERCMLEVY
jgi:hypothetical protein